MSFWEWCLYLLRAEGNVCIFYLLLKKFKTFPFFKALILESSDLVLLNKEVELSTILPILDGSSIHESMS